MSLMSGIIILLQSALAFIVGTILFDVVHFVLHMCLKSKYRIIRMIGRLHSAHHRFLSATLTIHSEWIRLNLLGHVLLEYVVEVTGTALCLFFLSPIAIIIAIFAETVLFFAVLYWRGIDPHHKPYTYLPSYRGGPWVSGEYHALHHVYPNKFFSGYFKILDYVLGSGMQITGKRIAMTGANGALGSNMKRLFEKEGAIVIPFKYGTDYHYADYTGLISTLEQTDILFLCHGSKYEDAQAANCDSFIAIIELFKSVRNRGLLPPEVWAVGSEIECHPCFGIEKIKVYARSKRNYAKAARKYFRDRDIQYRHIVHSAFTSKMGPGLMTANFAAKLTFFMLKRGFRYIPISYLGFAYLNYFRFALNF